MTRALTLHQPHATLFALGVRTIETRSWRAPDAAVGERLLIHAAAKRVPINSAVGDWVCWARHTDTGGAMLRQMSSDRNVLAPLGAIVASCTLAACVPMVSDDPDYTSDYLLVRRDGLWLYRDHDDISGQRVDDQRPYGDFAPGRWAWILSDVKPTTERCPADCRPVCFPDDADQERGVYRIATDAATAHSSWDSWVVCPTCEGRGSCPPVPAKGGQRIWRWGS